MAEIQPRIFGVGVAGSGIDEQNRFRDWAAVNGGDYRQLRYLGEMDVAFDRASTRMHRPAAYTLLAEGDFREEPGPESLAVVPGESRPQSAVELILDASGSMLQRMDGKRRINVVKEVLTEAVRRHIPAGTPVTLRVFGHKEVDSCRSAIESALQIPFTVYDADGNEVSGSQVGGAAIEPERAVYHVVVRTSPPRSFADVEVRGEDEITLRLE